MRPETVLFRTDTGPWTSCNCHARLAPYRVDTTGSYPFCRVGRGRIAWSSPLAIALWDVYPVSLGHAYNVGYNDGEAAGQIIMHFHVHVIPRYQGDALDPRGIRWVLPDKAAYWQSTEQ